MDDQQEARLRNLALSREKCEDVLRISLSLDGADEALIQQVGEFMLIARQALRGGRLNVRGSRHWSDI